MLLSAVSIIITIKSFIQTQKRFKLSPMLVGSCLNNCEYRTIRMKNKDKITYNIQLQLNSYILRKIQCVHL